MNWTKVMKGVGTRLRQMFFSTRLERENHKLWLMYQHSLALERKAEEYDCGRALLEVFEPGLVLEMERLNTAMNEMTARKGLTTLKLRPNSDGKGSHFEEGE